MVGKWRQQHINRRKLSLEYRNKLHLDMERLLGDHRTCCEYHRNCKGIDSIRNVIECCRLGNDLSCGDIVSSAIFSNTYLHDKHDRGIGSVDERRSANFSPVSSFSSSPFSRWVGNIGVIIALRHKCYKDRALYAFLNNLAITMVCDCVFVAPFVSGAMLTSDTAWLHASFLCPITSFVFGLIHTQITLSLLILVLDRIFSLKFSDFYIEKVIGVRANLIAGYTWIHSMAFTLAIVVTSVQSEYFQSRYICSVSYENNLAFNVVLSLFCHIAPWITVLFCYIYVVLLASETNARNDRFAETEYGDLSGLRGIGRELNYAKLIGILVLLWCVLIGPYQIMILIYAYSGNVSIPAALWTVFTCLKFIFDLLVSLVILGAWPEAWREFKHALFCRRGNAIETGIRAQLTTPGVRTSWADGSDGNSTDRSTLDRSTLSRSFPVPVLFATSNGLQLQLGQRGSRSGGDLEVAELAAENASEKYRKGNRPPPYLPPLFSVVHSSEEDSFNTESSMPLHANENGVFDLNESADSKTAISQFQLSLGKSEEFHTLKSTPASDISPSPRDAQLHETYSPEILSASQNSQHEPKRKASTQEHSVKHNMRNGNGGRRNTKDFSDQQAQNREPHNGRTKRTSRDSTDALSRNTTAKEQNQSNDGKEKQKRTNGAPKTNGGKDEGPPDTHAESGCTGAKQESDENEREGRRTSNGAEGGGRVGGRGSISSAVGRGLRSKEDAEKRQRHSSGKSVGSEKTSPRGGTATTSAKVGPSKPR